MLSDPLVRDGTGVYPPADRGHRDAQCLRELLNAEVAERRVERIELWNRESLRSLLNQREKIGVWTKPFAANAVRSEALMQLAFDDVWAIGHDDTEQVHQVGVVGDGCLQLRHQASRRRDPNRAAPILGGATLDERDETAAGGGFSKLASRCKRQNLHECVVSLRSYATAGWTKLLIARMITRLNPATFQAGNA